MCCVFLICILIIELELFVLMKKFPMVEMSHEAECPKYIIAALSS
jgi:hypothetical protein